MQDGQDFDDAPSGLPDWLSWIQLGLTTMLVVLFLVLLARGRDQRGELRALEARLEGLENSRALEREPLMEKQMQTIIQRLERLEGEVGRLETLGQQQQDLAAELIRLRDRRSDSNVAPSAPPSQQGAIPAEATAKDPQADHTPEVPSHDSFSRIWGDPSISSGKPLTRAGPEIHHLNGRPVQLNISIWRPIASTRKQQPMRHL